MIQDHLLLRVLSIITFTVEGEVCTAWWGLGNGRVRGLVSPPQCSLARMFLKVTVNPVEKKVEENEERQLGDSEEEVLRGSGEKGDREEQLAANLDFCFMSGSPSS